MLTVNTTQYCISGDYGAAGDGRGGRGRGGFRGGHGSGGFRGGRGSGGFQGGDSHNIGGSDQQVKFRIILIKHKFIIYT